MFFDYDRYSATDVHYWVAIGDEFLPTSEMELRELDRRRPVDSNGLHAFPLGGEDDQYGALLFDDDGRLTLAMIAQGKALVRDLICDMDSVYSAPELINLRQGATSHSPQIDSELSENLAVAYEQRELDRLEADAQAIRTRLSYTFADSEQDAFDD